MDSKIALNKKASFFKNYSKKKGDELSSPNTQPEYILLHLRTLNDEI